MLAESSKKKSRLRLGLPIGRHLESLKVGSRLLGKVGLEICRGPRTLRAFFKPF